MSSARASHVGGPAFRAAGSNNAADRAANGNSIASPLLKPFTPSALAIGVMATPSNAAYREAARSTWLPDAKKHATVRFVAGDVPCAREVLDKEADVFGDVVFVKSDDCKKWHSPAKINAWYSFALRAYPNAVWIAKMEDDGMLWTRPLVGALSAVRQRGSVYFGMMQWQGGCEFAEGKQPCAGCWGGWFNGGAPAPRHCMPMWRQGWKGSVQERTPECPMFRLAPFACGPFEARSRHLASVVARCEYATRYFAAMSKRGDKKQDWCVSADGGQGHALGACVRSMHVIDLGPQRQKYATIPQMNESHSVFIVHPIKSRGAERDGRRLPDMLNNWARVWTYLRRAPHVHRSMAEARLHFAANESRPVVERVPLAIPPSYATRRRA